MSMKIDPSTLVDPKFIGIPYALAGKKFDGADCIGICILWLEEQGLHYEYDDRHGPVLQHWWENNPRRFVNAMNELGTIIKFPELKKYDVILFFGDEPVNRFPTMLGVMVDDRHFLTCTEDRGSAVYMLSLTWKNKFFGCLRLHKAVEKGLA